MKVYYPENFFNILKDKHLLLDTNVLIDSFNFDRPLDYAVFFKKLKENNTTLTTIEGVVFEFIKGSKNDKVYSEKIEHLEEIIDVMIPPHKDDSKNIRKLIKLAGSDGGGIDMVDYYLGANILKYNMSLNNLFLMTRNVKDFPQHIFSLVSTVSFSSVKTIFTYGIYTYQNQIKTTEIESDDIPF